MALLYIDGFDAADAALRWVRTGVDADFSYAAATRFGAGKAVTLSSVTFNSAASLLHSITPSVAIYAGAAIKVGLELDSNASNPTANLFGLYSDGGMTGHIYIRRLTLTNAIALYRGDANSGTIGSPSGTQIAVSAAGVFDANWHYIEMHATIHDTTGRVIVKVDGNAVIDFTGDTRNAGTSTSIDAIRFRTAIYSNWTPNSPITIDDLYICDGTGMVNNTFLGDVRVQSLVPTGVGSSTQLTPTGSANNYANVNEVPYSSATYNASSTVGQRDTYALSDLVGNTTAIFGIQSVAHMQKNDAGTANAKIALKSGASVYYDATQSLGASTAAYVQLRETDPATSAAWTVGNANALEAGMEVA
jgi:hypothetical protein